MSGSQLDLEMKKVLGGQAKKVVVITGADPHIDLNLNGHQMQLKTGEPVEVAESVFEVLMNSNFDVEEVEKAKGGKRKKRG